MRNFKISFKSISVRLLLVFITLSGFLLIVNSKNYYLTFAIVSCLITIDILFCFGFKALIRISIGDNVLTLHYVKCFLIKDNYEILLSDLEYSYEYETGARGASLKELRFYNNGKKIIGIGRGYDGWKEEVILEILCELKKLNVRYSNK